MWKRIGEFVGKLFSLSQRMQKLEDDVKELREDNKRQSEKLDHVTDFLTGLALELKHHQEMTARDFDNLVLRIENALLRAQRDLPSADRDTESDEAEAQESDDR